MVTGYTKLENNSKVIDVIYALMLGEKTPKGIAKRLEQNKKTVTSKLFFLRKQTVVKKDKWNYQLDTNRYIESC